MFPQKAPEIPRSRKILTNKKNKNQLIETDIEMTAMIGLVLKDLKKTLITYKFAQV